MARLDCSLTSLFKQCRRDFSLTSTFTLAGGSEFGIATEKGDFGYSECISNAKACKHENRAAFLHCMVDLADGWYGLPVVTVESGNADTQAQPQAEVEL